VSGNVYYGQCDNSEVRQ